MSPRRAQAARSERLPAGIAGLILAAGGDGRFHGDGPKQLADVAGRPLLEHAVRAQLAVPALERIVVVLGAHADEVLDRVDFGDAEPVVCPSWADGQGASLRHGACELEGARKVVLTLGDAPLVTPQVIARFVDERPGARATYAGEPGHPVVLGPRLLRAATTLQPHQGLDDLEARWRGVECGHLCSGRDVDTAADLEAVRDEARALL